MTVHLVAHRRHVACKGLSAVPVLGVPHSHRFYCSSSLGLFQAPLSLLQLLLSTLTPWDSIVQYGVGGSAQLRVGTRSCGRLFGAAAHLWCSRKWGWGGLSICTAVEVPMKCVLGGLWLTSAACAACRAC